MKVYVDDLLTKSMKVKYYIADLAITFQTLRAYCMKLNSVKHTIGVASRKFLGFTMIERGIEANLDKIKALIEVRSPKNLKEIQKLTRRVIVLNCFVSNATDWCLPFSKP